MIANPAPRVFSPGLFMRVRLPVGAPHKSLLVPEQALGTDQGRKFLYVVKPGKDKDGKPVANVAEYRPVKVGALHDGLRVVTEGLEPGEKVIVSGLQRIRPGIEVDPKPMTTPAPPKAVAEEAKPGPAKADGEARAVRWQSRPEGDDPAPIRRPDSGGDRRESVCGSSMDRHPPSTSIEPTRSDLGPRETRPVFSQVLHRPADLRLGALDRHHPGRRHRALHPADRQYPQITPPTVVGAAATIPGASAKVVAETVATPIEQQVNGVEDMLYMSSQCTNDGSYNLTVTFELGVDLNMAQVLVQNRVSLAMPQLPDVLKQTGVNVQKTSPDILHGHRRQLARAAATTSST